MLATARCRTIEKNLGRPGNTQRRLLQKILRRLDGCQITHDLRIDNATSTDRFRSVVPVTDYSYYKPYVQKVLAGRKSIIFPGRPVCIAETGGTTSGPKQIPLGKHLIKSYRQFNLDMAFCYMQDSGHYDIFSDRIFLVVAGPDATRIGSNVPVGRATGLWPGSLRGSFADVTFRKWMSYWTRIRGRGSSRLPCAPSITGNIFEWQLDLLPISWRHLVI